MEKKKVVVHTHREPLVRKRLLENYDTKEFREYKHDNPKRGRAVIVNFNEFYESELLRKGSEKDVERLTDVLENGLGFEVVKWKTENMERDDLLQMVAEEAKREDHKNSDCFLMVLMTHGTRGQVLQAYSSFFYLEQVVDYFTGDRCPHLVEKPKIFLVQACRGGEKQSGVRVIPKGGGGSQDSLTLPKYADIVIAQSQYEGFASIRHTREGSYFIQSFCDVIEHDLPKPREKKDDLMTLLTLTAHYVANFEFMEKKVVSEDGAGPAGDGAEEGRVMGHDSVSSLKELEEGGEGRLERGGVEETEEVESDARRFDTSKIRKPSPPLRYEPIQLVKQQPTIISTLLRLYYFYAKGKDSKGKDNKDKE
ncbi:caspase-3-like [Ischnura elegans]|uniref:caspase-3-like n=1 Tax=Ischnura elegans TaxID=197161 RepID=UPI001ED894AD|nr:caspase-3-like [Ischnura elegans]